MQESLYLDFNPLAAASVVEFFSQSRPMSFSKGQIICRSDNPSQKVFCSMQGYVVSYSLTPDGRRDIHTFTRPKTVFPVTNLFSIELTKQYLPARTRFFEAMTDIEVWHRSEADFVKLLESDDNVRNALLKQVSMNHHIYATRLEMMQLRNVRLRLVSFLLILALLLGKPENNHARLETSVTHQLIADSIGLARETISRELYRLKQEGLITYKNHQLVLTDVNQLKQMVEDY